MFARHHERRAMTSASEHLEAIRVLPLALAGTCTCRHCVALVSARTEAVAALVLVQEAITRLETIRDRHEQYDYCADDARLTACPDHEDAVVALAALKGNT